MLFLSKRNRVFLVVMAVVIILISGTIYIKSHENVEVEEVTKKEPTAVEVIASPTPTPVEKDIIVYVCGNGVKTAQNVKLKEGARVEDAIKAAGGPLKEADLNQLNLAHILSDQEKVYVPKKGEAVPEQTASGYQGNNGTPESSVININTASAEQLDSLPGVGPSTAQKIISYRKTNGSFKSTDDLKNVSGIGDKKFEDLRSFITVN